MDFGWHHSLGVSIKMNVLLFAPPLAVLLMQRFGIIASIPKLLYCAAVQVHHSARRFDLLTLSFLYLVSRIVFR